MSGTVTKDDETKMRKYLKKLFSDAVLGSPPEKALTRLRKKKLDLVWKDNKLYCTPIFADAIIASVEELLNPETLSQYANAWKSMDLLTLEQAKELYLEAEKILNEHNTPIMKH